MTVQPTRDAASTAAAPHSVADAIADVRRRIEAAATRADRSPHSIALVAVSKGFGVEAVTAARSTGHADFGESKAQHLKEKASAAGPGIRWHFVGRMQRNKAATVVGTATLIHSVDRYELAQAIAERAERDERVQRVLLQVNVGDDPAKGGCSLEEAEQLLARIRRLDRVACEGLMVIPPLDSDPRPVFAQLRELRDRMRERYPEIQHLSMGMTHDFEVAVEEGATIVRVGEAIFGPRPGGA